MSICIQIPPVLRYECGGAKELSLSAPTVRTALTQLKRDYPALYRNVCDETGAVRRHVNLFLNNSFLHPREGLETVLAAGDVLTIMPSVSGG